MASGFSITESAEKDDLDEVVVIESAEVDVDEVEEETFDESRAMMAPPLPASEDREDDRDEDGDEDDEDDDDEEEDGIVTLFECGWTGWGGCVLWLCVVSTCVVDEGKKVVVVLMEVRKFLVPKFRKIRSAEILDKKGSGSPVTGCVCVWALGTGHYGNC